MAGSAKKNGLIIRGVLFGVGGLWLSITLMSSGISMSGAAPSENYGDGGYGIGMVASGVGSVMTLCGVLGLVVTGFLQVRIWKKLTKLNDE